MKIPTASASLIVACLFLSSCGDSSQQSSGKSIEVNSAHNRHIPLDGQTNFRDLGGYATTDGHTVKWGAVYRSGELQNLSDADVETLSDLGIKTVASFLIQGEIDARGADRVPEGTQEIHLPIDGAIGLGDVVEQLIDARKTGDFSIVPPEVNPNIHRATITSTHEQYSALLNTLADPDNLPMVFHCSHGVHRTGTGAAVLLSALGVPWETVREDYLLSNTYRKDENDKRIGQLRAAYAKTKGIPENEVDTTNIEAFYILQGSYIDASLEQAVADYGSMENYIREGLNISDETLQKLRGNLLEN
jgi:protein-tyrosine phosphatase